MRFHFDHAYAPIGLTTRDARIVLVHGVTVADDTRRGDPLVGIDATLQDSTGQRWRELIQPHQLRGIGRHGDKEAADLAALCRRYLDLFPPMNAARANALAAQKPHHADAGAPYAPEQDEPTEAHTCQQQPQP